MSHLPKLVPVRRLAAIAAVTFVILGLSAAAHASTAAPTTQPLSLDNTNSCTVPAGYTYDRVTLSTSCGSPGFLYHLKLPADNINVCTILGGYTYDRVTSALDTCNPTGFAFLYHMRVPVTGLWACTLPAGWTYTTTESALDTCNPSGFATMYRLTP